MGYPESLSPGHVAPEALTEDDRDLLRGKILSVVQTHGVPDTEADRMEAYFVLEPREIDFDGTASADEMEPYGEVEVICSWGPIHEPTAYQVQIVRSYYYNDPEDVSTQLMLESLYVVTDDLSSDVVAELRSYTDCNGGKDNLRKGPSQDESLSNAEIPKEMQDAMKPSSLQDYFDGENGDLPINTVHLDSLLPIFEKLDHDHLTWFEDADEGDE